MLVTRFSSGYALCPELIEKHVYNMRQRAYELLYALGVSLALASKGNAESKQTGSIIFLREC